MTVVGAMAMLLATALIVMETSDATVRACASLIVTRKAYVPALKSVAIATFYVGAVEAEERGRSRRRGRDRSRPGVGQVRLAGSVRAENRKVDGRRLISNRTAVGVGDGCAVMMPPGMSDATSAAESRRS